MKHMRHETKTALVALALLLGAPVAIAQDEPPATPPAAPPAAPETPPAATPDAGSDDDDVFIPTEELSADEEVTFPVDI